VIACHWSALRPVLFVDAARPAGSDEQSSARTSHAAMSHLAIAFEVATETNRTILAIYTPRIDRLRAALVVPSDLQVTPSIRSLALSHQHLFVATTPFVHQCEPEPSILVYRRGDGLFEGRFRLSGVVDIRGIHWEEGILRVVSAGTGEVIAFRCEAGRLRPDRFAWSPCFEPSEPPIDLRLRAITGHRHDLWLTALGAGASGLAFDLTRATVIARDLLEPGALLSHDDALWVVETGGHHIRTIDRAKIITLHGHPIGLCSLDGKFFSSVEDQLIEIDPVTAQQRVVRQLPGSLTDLATIDDAGDWPDEPDATWIDSHGLLLNRSASSVTPNRGDPRSSACPIT
jgi:hypothetical protein